MSQYLRVFLPAPGQGQPEVEIAGTRIEHQMSTLSISALPNQVPQVTIGLIARPLELSGQGDVSVDDATEQVLLGLGWTPPAKKGADDPVWVAGVRWAAAESDAQATGREPVYILDITDHLRACADDPQRRTAVAR